MYNSGRWWRTGKSDVLQFLGLQRAGHDLVPGQQQIRVDARYKCWRQQENQSNEAAESRLPSSWRWHSLEEESYVLWPIFLFKWLLTISFWNVQGRLVGPLGKPAFILPVQFSSVAQSCPTLCDPMDCSMPDLPVHHQLPKFTQTHFHWVSDAI